MSDVDIRQHDFLGMEGIIRTNPAYSPDRLKLLPIEKQRELVGKAIDEEIGIVLSNPQASIIITSHSKPDIDAISSSRALEEILKLKHPEASDRIKIVISDNNSGSFQDLDPNGSIIWARDYEGKEVADYVNEGDCLIMVDCNELYQASPKKGKEIGVKNISHITLDHHPINHGDILQPKGSTIEFSDTSAVSAGEVIAQTMNLPYEKLSPQTATTLLYGIMGDTRSMQFIDYGNMKNTTFSLIHDLLKISGVKDIESLIDRAMHISPQALEFLSIQYRHLKIDKWKDQVVAFTGSLNSEYPQSSGDASVKENIMTARRLVANQTGQAASIRVNVMSLSDGRYSLMFRLRDNSLTEKLKTLFDGKGLDKAFSGNLTLTSDQKEFINQNKDNNLDELGYIYDLITEKFKNS